MTRIQAEGVSNALTESDADLIYLRLDTTNDPLTGKLEIFPDTLADAEYGLDVNPAAFTYGATKKTPATIFGGRINMDVANRDANIYGMLNGLRVAVNNNDSAVNVLTASIPRGIGVDYDGYGGHAISVYGVYVDMDFDGTVNVNDHFGVLVQLNDNNSSTATSGGMQASRFEARNSNTGSGDTKAYVGFAENNNAGSTGRCYGVVGATNIAAGSTALSVPVFAAGSVFGVDSRKYAFVGNNSSFRGMNLFSQTWITTSQDLASSNPSSRGLVPNPANHDMYIERHLEVDGTLYVDGEYNIVCDDTGVVVHEGKVVHS